MNRREILKKIMMASGALVALPAWAGGWHVSEIRPYQSTLSLLEQDLLASVSDAIIPAADSIGALSVGVDKFLQKLIADCYEKEVQENVQRQLTALDEKAKGSFGKSFTLCDLSQRQELFLKLENSADQNEKDFYELIKSETIRGFRTSREVMTNYLNYKVAPGHYHGCVDVNT